MTEHGANTRGIKIALVSYSILVSLQVAAYVLTNIMVLLAQALEMLSDVMISLFLLLSVRWSRTPADQFHMFGYGRAQNVAALVSATILISFMSVKTFREAIPKLFQAPEIAKIQDTSLALIVILVGMVVMALPIMDILKSKAGGASVKVQLISLFKDEVSYVAALVAVILAAWTGGAWTMGKRVSAQVADYYRVSQFDQRMLSVAIQVIDSLTAERDDARRQLAELRDDVGITACRAHHPRRQRGVK